MTLRFASGSSSSSAPKALSVRVLPIARVPFDVVSSAKSGVYRIAAKTQIRNQKQAGEHNPRWGNSRWYAPQEAKKNHKASA